MRRILTSLVFVLLATVVLAQEGPPPEPPPGIPPAHAVVAKKKFVLHPEPFAMFGNTYFEDVLLDDGEPPGSFTVSIAYQLAAGSGRWRTCDPNTDRECTEANAPRFAFGGIGVAWAPNGGVGWGLQFPLLTVRVIRNAWLGTAVSVWPKAPEWRRNASFTLGLSISLAP